MHYLTICAIVRDEGLYIKEWVKYHLALGFERIYLIDNDCSDDTIKKAKEEGGDAIESIAIHGNGMQEQVYNMMLPQLSGRAYWVLFIDVDEFFVPKFAANLPANFGIDVIKQGLRTMLKDYECYAGVAIFTTLFGSNWRTYYLAPHVSDPVISRFTRCDSDPSSYFKCLVRPDKMKKSFGIHTFIPIKDTDQIVDEYAIAVPTGETVVPGRTTDKMQINHYRTKSKMECLYRRRKPRCSNGQAYPEGFFEEFDKNDIEDLTALKIWNKINGT